jgi:hypothetical protein
VVGVEMTGVAGDGVEERLRFGLTPEVGAVTNVLSVCDSGEGKRGTCGKNEDGGSSAK